MRLIDADALNLDYEVEMADDWKTAHEIANCVKYAPTVDAVPVVHGKWIHLDPREYATISGKCSCCGWEAHYYEDDVADMPYCPNCGAKMDGGSE